MKILGIDQSLTATGLALVQDGNLEKVEVFRPKSLKGPARVEAISAEVLLWARGVDQVVIERPFAHGLGVSSTMGLMGLFGVLVQDMWRQGVPDPLVLAPKTRCKYATGKGNANKDQVLAAVIRRYDSEDINDNNAADAVVFAAIGARLIGEPVEESLPQTHLAALDGITRT